MLLIRGDDSETRNNVAFRVRNHAVPLKNLLTRAATIGGQRHPACIDDEPVAAGLMADDRRQHAKRNVFGTADPETDHRYVVEIRDPNPCLGIPAKLFSKRIVVSSPH